MKVMNLMKIMYIMNVMDEFNEVNEVTRLMHLMNSLIHEFNEVLHLNNLTINVLGLSFNSTSSIKMAMEQNLATRNLQECQISSTSDRCLLPAPRRSRSRVLPDTREVLDFLGLTSDRVYRSISGITDCVVG